MSTASTALLTAEHIRKVFTRRNDLSRTTLRIVAVDDVSICVHAHETLALVGESGSGKSTLARICLRLLNPDAGAVRWNDQDVTRWPERRLRSLRATKAMVFQDPYNSLNPRHSVGRILAGPLLNHHMPHDRSILEELLTSTGLKASDLDRHPHEFSGGQRQRIGIARALATNPELIVADEPVSALDVSIRAQVLNLLNDAQQQRGLGILLVSHDLALVHTIADTVAVMKSGKIVEFGPVKQVYEHPSHPYTKALLDAAPIPDPHRRRLHRTLPVPNEHRG